MKAVVAGATGLVGSQLVADLLNDSKWSQVVVLSRRPWPQKNLKVKEVIVGDLSEISSHKDDLAGDVYFCCLGTTIKTAGSREAFEKVDLIAVRDFAEVAKRNRAKTFVLVSASGANPKSRIYYSRIKGQAEQAIEAAAPRVVIFRPSLLLGERTEVRPGEKFFIGIFSLIKPLLPQSFATKLATSAQSLARRMREEAVLSNPDGVYIVEASDLGVA
jgi:uncharacterized protein YbjT (DUF2867 family)